MHFALENTPLGRAVPSPEHYDPALLVALDRAPNRSALALPARWYGADAWNAWELSWLNARGKPQVAMGRLIFPWDSPRLIESKSLKLYLNSFNQTRLADADHLVQHLVEDLSAAAGSAVTVEILSLHDADARALRQPEGTCLDTLDIAIEDYLPRPGLLACRTPANVVSETLYSDLLRSNCPVTGQPDWGSVQIRYTGPAIDHAALLKYIVSLRRHTEFHEHCVEMMFCDLWRSCRPEQLCVAAFYLRRGGLDINPWRASQPMAPPMLRTPRQ